MDYKIVSSFSSSYDVSELEGEVKEAINDGWKPQGGISCSISNTVGLALTFFLCQAMVK